jgi:hypothetical protein
MITGCAQSESESIPPETVIRDHFTALGSGDLDTAMSLVADDAKLWMIGNCFDKEAFRSANEAGGPPAVFEPSDFRIDGNDVYFKMKVTVDGQVVDPGSDAYAYVEDGLIKYTGDCELR